MTARAQKRDRPIRLDGTRTLTSLLVLGLLASGCGSEPPAVPEQPIAEAADPVGEAAPPTREMAPTCEGDPTSFTYSFWTGHVGPGHVYRHVVKGELAEESVNLEYSWGGDIKGPNSTVKRGELKWSGEVTGEDARTWRSLLTEPLYALDEDEGRDKETGGHTKRLTITHGECTTHGEPASLSAWESEARELRVMAGSELPHADLVAYGLASDVVTVEVVGEVQPLMVEVNCPSGKRVRSVVKDRRARIGGIPQEDCTLRFSPGHLTWEPASGGMRLSCELSTSGATCTPG